MSDPSLILHKITRIEYLTAKLREAVHDENIIFARLVELRNEVHDATVEIFSEWPEWKQKGKAQASTDKPKIDLRSVVAALANVEPVERRF